MINTSIHTLDSLRKIIRNLEEENKSLKFLLEQNGISYENDYACNEVKNSEEYDEDQGSRILPLNPNLQMAKEFYGKFWGREDVYAKRGKNGGYFPQCKNRWDASICPKAAGEQTICDDNWRIEVDALRQICMLNNIDVLVERSRSGRGAHAWILFSEAIPAALARQFGFALLERGASQVNLTSFKYYDRMYPSQDVLN